MPRNESKYAAVLPNLKPLPPDNPSYQAKVDNVKAKIEDRHAVSLAEGYVRLRKEKEKIEAVLALVDLDIKAHEQLLTESQETKAPGWGAYGVKDNAVRLANGDTVRINKEPAGKVIDKEKFRLWCIANGYESQLQLWPSTMNAMVKERLLAGEAEPEGTEAYSYTKVVFVKSGAE